MGEVKSDRVEMGGDFTRIKLLLSEKASSSTVNHCSVIYIEYEV